MSTPSMRELPGPGLDVQHFLLSASYHTILESFIGTELSGVCMSTTPLLSSQSLSKGSI